MSLARKYYDALVRTMMTLNERHSVRGWVAGLLVALIWLAMVFIVLWFIVTFGTMIGWMLSIVPGLTLALITFVCVSLCIASLWPQNR